MATLHKIVVNIKRQAVTSACLLVLSVGFSAQAEQVDLLPQRVVSINLCTDQLAMLLADKSQLHSVSAVASDPVSSALAQQAGEYVPNYGQVEEITLMQPDLILASIYTSREKMALLRQLGFRIEEFGTAQNLTDIRADLRRMGKILGQEARAEVQIAQMDQQLGQLASPSVRPKALLFEPNGLTSGAGTLASETMHLAGVHNLALDDKSLAQGRVGLEQLVLLHPDMLIKPLPYDKPALAYANYGHPAVTDMTSASGQKTVQVIVPTRNWACGTPAITQAAHILNEAAQAIAEKTRLQQSDASFSEGLKP